MSPDEASSVSERMLQPAREESERRRARVLRRRSITSRLGTGAAALLGYYFGHKLALDLSSNPLTQQGIAMALGLLAAVVWPSSARRP